MTFGRHWIAVAAVVPLLVLGACSQDDPQPKFSPPSDSPSASESTPTEPGVRPWEKKTRKGAVAFSDHWLSSFNDAATSGDTGELLKLSTRDCETCSNFVSAIKRIHEGGGSFESTGWKLKGFSFAASGISDRVSLALTIHQPAEVTRRPGEQPDRTRPGDVSYQADLVWEEDQWRMDELFYVGDA